MNKRNLSKSTVSKYERIVDEWFVNGFNGAQAYKKFNKNIKKDATAIVSFSRLQALPEMEVYISEKHKEASKFVEMTKEGILQELKNWIQSDITETISLTPEQIKELPVEIRRLITKYKVNEVSHFDKDGALLKEMKTIELHFVSKERAIDMINKHIGFYEADNKQKTSSINYEGLSEATLLEIWNARKND